MLALNRTRRQTLATMALVLLAVVPTALVVAWSIRVNRPEYRHVVADELGRRLGLRVEIGAVRHPTPGLDVYEGVVFRDEDGSRSGSRLAELARADRLEVSFGDGRLAIRAEGLAISEAVGPAVDRLEEALRKAGAVPGLRRLDLLAPTLAIGSDGGSAALVIRDLAATAELRPTGGELSASGRLPGPDDTYPRCELRLVGGGGDSGSGPTTITLRTAEGPILARVLDPIGGLSEWLGPDAMAEGLLTFEHPKSNSGETGWDLRAEGDLSAVDLAELVTRRFPGHDLRGVADLKIDEARWGELPGTGSGRGWLTAKGRIAGGPGAIGPGLLGSLAGELGFRLDPSLAADLQTRLEPLPYSALGLAFAIEPDGGIILEGRLGGDLPIDATLAAVGDDLGTSTVLAPSGSSSVLGLWKALVLAPDDVLVPATAEAQVFRHLPLPTGGRVEPGAIRGN